MDESLSDMIIKGLMISILALVVGREVLRDTSPPPTPPPVQPSIEPDKKITKPNRKKWHPLRPWLNEEEEIHSGD